MPSDNLGITFVSTSQNQKELTINDAINALDKSGNSSLNITITTHRTLTAAEYTGNVLFNLSGSPGGAFNLVIPTTKRVFAVRNNTGQTATVKYAASGSFPVSTGHVVFIHSDGTNIVGLGGGVVAFTDLTDVPSTYAGSALYKVRVNAAATALEFVEDTATFTGGTLTSALNEAPITTLASASTTNIGAEAANTINISGTTTITSFGTIASGALRRLVFQGALILTHNGTSLILPTAANITTAAGDVAEFVSLGSGNWRCTNYERADGTALVASGSDEFEIGTFLGGLQLANTLVFKHLFRKASTFADDFAGSGLQADVAATAERIYNIRKNGSNVGTITVAASGTTGTFATTGGATSYAVGDRLEITTPTAQDATLADVSISLLGTRD